VDAVDLSCAEVLPVLTDYLEGALTLDRRARVERHLATCANCDDHLARLRMTIRLAGRLTERALDPGMRADLLAAFRGWRDA
jgi:anti-sigma factor RsiW